MTELDEHVLEELYTWVDLIPLTRPKRDLKRDFSDGVLVAEVVRHFLPNLVELHNYTPALAVNKKLINWHLLNRKVFKRMGFEVNEDVIKNIINCQPFAIEQFLLLLHKKIDQFLEGKAKCDKPEVDQVRSILNQNHAARKVTYTQQPDAASQRVQSLVVKPNGNGGIPAGHQMAHVGKKGPPSMEKQAAGGDVVTRQTLEEKDEQLKAKDETIEILEAKIHRLEQLLQLKEIRIEDLQTRLNETKTMKTMTTLPARRVPLKT